MAIQENIVSELLDRYGNTVLRLAYSYMGNQADAEDVTQDVFLKIIEKQPNFNDTEHEKAWIIRVTINMCKNKLKSPSGKTSPLEDAGEIAVSDGNDKDSDVLNAVNSLPAPFKSVVHLFYYEGYKTEEIAKMIGKREATVRSMLHRAREQLKILLTEEEYDFE